MKTVNRDKAKLHWACLGLASAFLCGGCHASPPSRTLFGGWVDDHKAPGVDSMVIFNTDGTYSITYSDGQTNDRYMGTYNLKGSSIELSQTRYIHNGQDSTSNAPWSGKLVWLSDDHIEIRSSDRSTKYSRFKGNR